MTTYRGIIRGRTIELAVDPGLADGQQVTVEVEPSAPPTSTRPGEGIRRSAGAWSNVPNIDELIDSMRAFRQEAKSRDLES